MFPIETSEQFGLTSPNSTWHVFPLILEKLYHAAARAQFSQSPLILEKLFRSPRLSWKSSGRVSANLGKALAHLAPRSTLLLPVCACKAAIKSTWSPDPLYQSCEQVHLQPRSTLPELRSDPLDAQIVTEFVIAIRPTVRSDVLSGATWRPDRIW